MKKLLRRFSFLLLIASLSGCIIYSYLAKTKSSPQFIQASTAEVQEHDSHPTVKKKTPEERARFALERAQFEFDMQKDPKTGKIPDRIKEQELAQAYRAPTLTTNSRGLGVTAEARGPNNLGGRSRAICFDVRNPQIILAGGVSSGVFKTTNGGASWTKVSSNSAIHNVTTIVQDTRTGFEDTWYYATGEAIGNSADLEALYSGQGIWKSTDNGDSWTLLGTSNYGSLESFDSRADYISRMVVDPTNGDVYAASVGQILRSENGGVSWESVLVDGAGIWFTSWMTDIIVTPTGRLYAGFSGFSPAGMDGIWTSTTGDSGDWTRIAASGVGSTPASWHANGAYGRLVLAYAPSDETVIYALYYNGEVADCTPITMEADLFRLDFNGISTWTFTDLSSDLPAEDCGDFLEHAGNDPFAVQGGYDLCIEVKPDDEDVFFVGGTNAYQMNYAAGSATFTRIGGYAGPTTYAQTANHHSDIHIFAFKPGDPDTLFTGTDGGLQKTDLSPTISWISLNNDYVTYQDYHVAISPTIGSDLILGGSQDNGTHISTTGTTHSQWLSGDGVACGISTGGDYYMGVQRGPIFRDLAGAGGFSEITPAAAGSGIFVTYFYLDPDNTEYLYYASNDDLYRTSTASTVTTATWTTMTGIGATLTGDIRSMATSRGSGYAGSDANRKLYIGTSNGQVYRLNDPAFTGAATVPTNITPSGAGSGIVSGISVNPIDDDEVLITYSNYSTTSVYHSTNGGTSWTDVEGNLTLPSFRSSAIMYNGGNTYYFVGTSVGLFCSQIMSGSSTEWSQVDPTDIGYAVVSALRVRASDDHMVVGTHGNGNFMVEPPRNPEIVFVDESSEVTESSVSTSSCQDYQVITVDMRVLSAPTGAATATLSLGGTAQEGADYDIITAGDAVTFPDGAASTQTFTIWIYDDSEIEVDETIVLTYSISGTTDATAGSFNQTHTINIKDNDNDPATIPATIWAEDWDGVVSGWTISAFTAPTNRWGIFTGCAAISGLSALIVFDDGAGGFFCAYDETDPSTHEIYKTVNATGYQNLEVSFDYVCLGEGTVASPIDYGSVVYSTDGGTTWIPVGDPLVGASTITAATVVLPAVLDGTSFLLGWQWINNGSIGNYPPMSLDNIVVRGGLPAAVESDLTAGTVDENLGPFETAYFYDGAELMCKIENTSSHDFGCTSVSIDRTGTSAVDFWYAGVANDPKDLASKTYLVTPTNNSGSASYNITLYYTSAEVSGWEAATGKTFSTEIQMVKNPGVISNVTPGTNYPDGAISIDSVTLATLSFGTSTSTAVTGTFSNGFSGFGVGDPGPPPATLPVEWLDFQASPNESVVDLTWLVGQELNVNHYEVERSEDGLSFSKIGEVQAIGEDNSILDYHFQDQDATSGLNYYRVRQVDLDGRYSYSNRATAWIGPAAQLEVNPTVFDTYLTIQASFEQQSPAELILRLYQIDGKKVLEQRWNHSGDLSERLEMPSSIPGGVYLYEIRSANHQFQGKLVKR